MKHPSANDQDQPGRINFLVLLPSGLKALEPIRKPVAVLALAAVF